MDRPWPQARPQHSSCRSSHSGHRGIRIRIHSRDMSVVSAIKKVGISLGLRLGISTPLAIVSKGGDNSGVLLDDGLAKAVGDDSAGANGQGSLAGIIDLGVKGGGTEDGGDLVDGSLQLTV